MGMIWKFKMVLLSTLAALVIIVHSAEEDYEDHYRRDLRPRMLDTGTPRTYEQPWRTMDVDMPGLHRSTPDETWMDSSSEEPPRRRRPKRKRKRRPEPVTEDLVPMERYAYPDEPRRPYFDLDSSTERKTSEVPKRRRKKEPKAERWDSPVEEDRPIRRRGQRRKRPSLETWPVLSEFNDYRPNAPPIEIDDQITSNPINRGIEDDYRHSYDTDISRPRFAEFDNVRELNSEKEGPKSEDAAQGETYNKYTNDQKSDDSRYPQTALIDDDTKVRPQVTEDRSLSEFIIEDVPNRNAANITMKDKMVDKTQVLYFKEQFKAQADGPIDPLTLKDILKKSNGTSLSEILQQHNLSLTDLLQGKEHVLSILNARDSAASNVLTDSKRLSDNSKQDKESSEERLLINSETKYALDSASENPTMSQYIQNVDVDVTTDVEIESTTTETPNVEETPKRHNIRRYPTAIRRKQRIRPMMNTTYKSQLSRDMLTLNARKYFNNRRRNSTHEWKDLLPMMKKNMNNSNDNTEKRIESETTTINNSIEETTISQDYENCTKSAETDSDQNITSEDIDKTVGNTAQTAEKGVDILKPLASVQSDQTIIVTEKPISIITTTQAVNASVLRRQAFNNRLKKKRLKQKNLTTVPPQDDIMINLFGIPNLVSSSEFISQTHGPKTNLDDVTILEDFITTETPHYQVNRGKNIRYSSPKPVVIPQFIFEPSSTEETARIEIAEIFNDTRTSVRLSKILKERNMTFSELVEHRERGSSHVHLADIFHNASKEPNPPEPFLSKSLIEPISKETYPLRALLDANNHDTTAKATTIDPTMPTTEVNIPVIMNFGNNVNENAENMGIMSLFHNITNNATEIDITTLNKDSQGTLYETSITVVNTTDDRKENETLRESRVINVSNDNQDDIVSWNEIFSLMRNNYDNQTDELLNSPQSGLIPAEKIKNPMLEKDLDGDGLIVLEDLQHLKDFDSKATSMSNENIDINSYERADTVPTNVPSVSDKITSQTKSVTVATACIAGLAMVLFLLTYVGYKWKQQSTLARKKSFADERVPTPVFENRKGHKNNSSSRSISPMISSNIYTLNTLDSRNGKESPDYMWDSLRKPFQ